MSEIRLGIQISARDQATAELKSVEERVRLLQSQIKSLIDQTAGWSVANSTVANSLGAVAGALQADISAGQTEIGVLKERLRLLDQIAISEQNAAKVIVAEATKKGLQPLQYAFQVTNQPELVEPHRDSRGRFVPGQGEGTLAAAIIGAQADAEKAKLNAKLFQDAADEHAATAKQRFDSPLGVARPAVALSSSAISDAQLKAVTAEIERQQSVMRQLGAQAGEYTSQQVAQAQTRIAVLQAETAALRARAREEERAAKERFQFVQQISPKESIAEREKLEKDLGQASINVQKMGLEEEKRLGKEAADLKRQYYQNVANDAAMAAAAERRAAAQSALGSAGFRQLPLTERLRLIRADDATREAAGLQFYTNASREARAAIEAVATSAENSGNAIRSHAGHTRDATSASRGWGFALREIVVELGESARGARGQQISTLLSAARQVGGGTAALRVGAPLAATFAVIGTEHLVSHFAHLAVETHNAAAAAGIAVEKYSLLVRTLQLMGVSANTLATAMGTVSQSVQTALAEPLGQKGIAFATIFGPDYLNQIRGFMEEPLQSIEQFRKRYGEMVQQFGQFRTMEIFRAALGSSEWKLLAPAITATEEAYRKFQQTASGTRLPFTEAEVEKLKVVDEASKKLGEDWEALGKAIALLAGNTGFIEFLDRIVVKLGDLARNAQSAAIGVAGITGGAALGAAIGTVVAPGVGTVVGAGIGTALGGAGAASVANQQQAIDAATPQATAKIPPADSFISSESSARTITEQRNLGVLTPPDAETQRRYPQLYGSTPPTSGIALIAEAEKARSEIEQTSRLENARLEAAKAQAELESRSDQERQTRVRTIEQEQIANRQRAVQAEQQLLELYKQRGQGIDASARPNYERELETRIGVSIRTEEYTTQRQAAEEQKRFNDEVFRIHSANSREMVTEARGDWSQISAIYADWYAKAVSIFGSVSTQAQTVFREWVRASQDATDKIVQDHMRIADTFARVGRSDVRMQVEALESRELQRGIGRVDKTAVYAQEAGMLQALGQQEIAMYQEVANMAGITAEKKIEALNKALSAAQQTATEEVQLARKISEEQKKSAEEASRAFVQFFDKAGGALENLIDAAVFKTKTRGEAFKDFFTSLSKDVIHTGLSLGSQFAAQGLAKATGVNLEPGKGLGDLLGNMVGKALGLGEKHDYQSSIDSTLKTANQQREVADGIRRQILAALTEQKSKLDAGGKPEIPRPSVGETKGIPVERYSLSTRDIPGATEQEKQVLSQVRAREAGGFGSGDYNKLHYALPGQPAPQTIEDIEKTKVTKNSHAFGYYGFQPGTYRDMGKITGRFDLSEESQDINALALLRKYGPNATQSWAASAPPGGYKAGPVQTVEATPVTSRTDIASGLPDINSIGNLGNRGSQYIFGTRTPPANAGRIVPDVIQDYGIPKPGEAHGPIPPGYKPPSALSGAEMAPKVETLNTNADQAAKSTEKLSQSADAAAKALEQLKPGTTTDQAAKSPDGGTTKSQSSVNEFLDYGFFGRKVLDKPLLPSGEVGAYNDGGDVDFFAAGGGPKGTDTIPAWLSPGEFVNQTSSVNYYGSDFFHALNQRKIPKDKISYHAAGGVAGGAVSETLNPGGFSFFQDGGLADLPEIVQRSILLGKSYPETADIDYKTPGVHQFRAPKAGEATVTAEALASAHLNKRDAEISERLLDYQQFNQTWPAKPEGSPGLKEYWSAIPKPAFNMPMYEDMPRFAEGGNIENIDINSILSSGMPSLNSSASVGRIEIGNRRRYYNENYKTPPAGSLARVGKGIEFLLSGDEDLPQVLSQAVRGVFGNRYQDILIENPYENKSMIADYLRGPVPPTIPRRTMAQIADPYKQNILGEGPGQPTRDLLEEHFMDGGPVYAAGGAYPLTKPSNIGGFTFESRGFLAPQLVTVYPKPNIWSSIRLLGMGLLGIGALVGATKLFGDSDQEKLAKDPKLAKKIAGADYTPDDKIISSNYSTPLSQDYVNNIKNVSRLAEGGIASYDLLSDDVREKFKKKEEQDPLSKLFKTVSGINSIANIGSLVVGLSSEKTRAEMPAVMASSMVGSMIGKGLGKLFFQQGGMLPHFHTGGVASDELLAILQKDERVLNRQESRVYDSLPKFHGGGFVWPSFAEGGPTDPGMVSGSEIGGTGIQSSSDSGVSNATKTMTTSVINLSSNMNALSSDVRKIAGGFSAIERSMSAVPQSTNKLSSSLSSASSALGGFQSILGAFSGMGGGGGGGGGGGFLGTALGVIGGFAKILPFFGLEKGGIATVGGQGGPDSQLIQFMATPGERISIMTPDQYNNSRKIGGLPGFAGGGMITVGGKDSAPNISEFVQGMASSSTGGVDSGGGGVNVHIGAINGVLNAHDVDRLLTSRFGSIAKGFQRASRNNFDLPGH